MLLRSILIVLLLTCSSLSLLAAEFSGVVVDPDGQPIGEVNISVAGQMFDHTAGERGTFSFNSDSQTVQATLSHVGYKPRLVELRAGEIVTIVMQPAVLPMQGMTVAADRAVLGQSPISFTDFTAADIERDYSIGEFPLLLETTPNLYAFADAGGGLGYSYMKIRGFSDKHITTFVNGVPLNDPEDQATYFVDLPDFAANVKDIQVQRGVGNALHGGASFGGSVNIVSAGLEQGRSLTLASGYGGFWQDGEWVGDMEKQSIEYSSGLIGGRWNLAARYSRQLSDGYRRDSWYDGWSYYISASRLDHDMTTTVNVYGGPMQMHLTYYGVSRDILEEDRRFNPLTYDNETDNFNQPHYELHNTWRLGDKLTLDNTFFHIHGRGYYEQYKDDRDFEEYNISPVPIVTGIDTVATFAGGDLVRQQWVVKNQWGWTPRLEIKHNKGDAALGGSFYYFESDHWGQVVWAEHVTNSIDPRHRYYEYFGEKLNLSLFATTTYEVAPQLTATAGAQFRHQTYDFDQTVIGAFGGNDYNLDWTYFSPRLGLTYELNKAWSLIGSYSLSFRTPTDVEVYEANDPYAVPTLDIKMERVHDIELGVTIGEERFSGSVNLFYMDFENEIVPYGGVTDYGTLGTINADKSLHSGIELSATGQLSRHVELTGNFAYNYNRYRDFSVAEDLYDNDSDWNWLGYEQVEYADKVIPGFPDYIGNLIAEYRAGRFDLAYRARLIGKQYVENDNVENLAIDPYFVSSISVGVLLGELQHFGRLSLNVRVNNIFNENYESSGYGGALRFRDSADQHWSEYYVAAERSIFSTLKLELH